MLEKYKHFILNLIGLVLIIISLLRFYSLYLEDMGFHIFWLCNHIPFIMGLAILFRNSFILIGEFCLGFLGMFVLILDYFSYAIFKISFTGNTEFFSTGTYFIIAFFLHILTLPLAFFAILMLNKKQEKAFFISIIHFLLLIPPIIYFGYEKNLNCFFGSCLSFLPTFKFYTIFLLAAYFLIFILPINYLINKLLKNS